MFKLSFVLHAIAITATAAVLSGYLHIEPEAVNRFLARSIAPNPSHLFNPARSQ